MSFPRLLLAAALLGLSGVAAAQTGAAGRAFSDPDFELTLTLPPGMIELPHDEAAVYFQRKPEEFNLPRSESPNGRTSHTYLWTDGTGREREMRLLAEDMPPAFGSPDQVKEWAEVAMQLTIDGEGEALRRGEGFMSGMRIEGTRERADGSVVRSMAAYFPIPPDRYILVTFQSLEIDWDLVSGDFIECLRSLRFPPPAPPAKPGSAGAAATGKDGKPVKTYTESWESLEVAGSLVLGLALLMGLFLGGKAATAA